jgi:hypothetical protein
MENCKYIFRFMGGDGAKTKLCTLDVLNIDRRLLTACSKSLLQQKI